jgi:diguanylate cyclase (GGDEF)-like protein
MPAHGAMILVVLDDGIAVRRVFGRPSPPPPFAVARWARLPETSLRSGGVDAVLYSNAPRRAARPERLARLRRLAPGLPLLPFVLTPEHRPRAREGGEARPPVFRAPLDATLIRAFVEREREAAEQRQRARRTLGQARDQAAKLKALAAIVRATGSELDPHRIVEMAMEQVSLFLNLRAWLFLLADAEQGLLAVEQTGGDGVGVMKGARIRVGDGIAGRCAQRRQPVLVEDVGTDGSTYGVPELPRQMAARSIVAVPLLSRGRLIGVVEAVDTMNAARFRGEDARLLSLLLEPAAVAVDNALLLRRSEELSITDDLTKLYNSRFLNATLRREVERSKRYRTPVSLIFLDLDGFKSVNDQYGHLFGSRTLVEVGSVIKTTVREIDVVSRFGGDEFTVILPQTGPEGAQIIAERIRQRIEETTFLASEGLGVRITASVGIASFPDHGRSKDDLIARADQAMYTVKGRGKNGVAQAETHVPLPVAGPRAG